MTAGAISSLPRVLGADSEEESVMGIGTTVELQNVKVVAESVLGLCCRITGRDHWIAPPRLLAGFANEKALVRALPPL